MKTDIAVTSLGMFTPLGRNVSETWNRLISAETAVKKNGYLLASCEDCFEHLFEFSDDKSFSMMKFAVDEAISDSGLSKDSRAGFFISQSKPEVKIFNDFADNIPGLLGSKIAEKYDFESVQIKNIVAACSTGVQSIFSAINAIESGACDFAVVGVVESSLTPLYIGAFSNMGVLSKKSMRPFDKKRDGFALGEGAAAVVLEKRTNAEGRGAAIHSLIKSCNVATAGHPVNFGDSVKNISELIRRTLKQSGVNTVDHINAHGTATRINDAVESEAIIDAFGKDADYINISATKPATGHLLGASGIVEFIFCVLSVKSGVVPPTLNLEEPEYRLNFTPKYAVKREVKNALSLSYGFGGQMGAIICGV